MDFERVIRTMLISSKLIYVLTWNVNIPSLSTGKVIKYEHLCSVKQFDVFNDGSSYDIEVL